MSKRGSKSALFVSEVRDFARKITVRKNKIFSPLRNSVFNTPERSFGLKAPKDFVPKIKFFTKIIIYTKNQQELVKYVHGLEANYELLSLVIKKPDKAEIFRHVIHQNINTMRSALLDIQARIREIEIMNYYEIKEHQHQNDQYRRNIK